MKDDDIISSMVKGRECCRQLVQAYESVHSKTMQSEQISNADLALLTKADKVVSTMLSCFQNMPTKPKNTMDDNSNRDYASRLLSEITELLEKAMILEREVRNNEERKPSQPIKNTPGLRSLKAYAGG